ncbi:anti-sigma-I factor RsgI6-like isoform X2 [Dreissena polymorpha]|uniref:anti-sigma-I factor RsgI6-like isoform X2 n=1 Tax=Dreissena polymorpha TaxID=45954 RepID=UPI002265421D|nr:anti-sigma-I factor RsgI6-like isoform X2 [Dreissena polymorpha]
MSPTLFVLLIFVSLLIRCNGEITQLVHDPDMEGLHQSWKCRAHCTLTPSHDAHTGKTSLLVTNRGSINDGLSQSVNLTPNGRYNFTFYVKLLNLTTGNMYDMVQATLACSNANHIKFGQERYTRLNHWTKVGGVAHAPADTSGCFIRVQVSDIHADHVIDDVSLVAVPNITDWRAEANERIESIRKSNITIRLTGAEPNANYEIELYQTKHEFAFGSAISATQFIDPAYSHYQHAFYENFEWAVLENDLKWQQMERRQGHIHSTEAMATLKSLNASGIKVRGHNVFWGVDLHTPTWVTTLSQHDLQVAMDNRINNVVAMARNYVRHWDVNNENLHGDFYEQRTRDPNITMKMFSSVHKVDPNALLFLNDFGIMENNVAQSLRNQAMLFKSAGVPIHGIGIQSHLHKMDLDITAMKDVMTLYFSHPAIKGILLWGFWNGRIYNTTAALFEGPNVQPNAAGLMYQELFKTTWRTNVTLPVHGNGDVTVRGFQGVYKVTVKKSDKELTNQYVSVIDDKAIVLDISGLSAPAIVG